MFFGVRKKLFSVNRTQFFKPLTCISLLKGNVALFTILLLQVFYDTSIGLSIWPFLSLFLVFYHRVARPLSEIYLSACTARDPHAFSSLFWFSPLSQFFLSQNIRYLESLGRGINMSCNRLKWDPPHSRHERPTLSAHSFYFIVYLLHPGNHAFSINTSTHMTSCISEVGSLCCAREGYGLFKYPFSLVPQS